MKYNIDQKIENRYKIQSLLGTGGMGETYLVFDEVTKQTQALKLLYLKDSSVVSAFKQEFEFLSSLNNSNLVTVYEFGILSDSECYYTMEYINGDNILEYYNKNIKTKEDLPKFYEILQQSLKALGYIHSKGIIHNDLKPENILIKNDNSIQVKLLDFGLSLKSSYQNDTSITGTMEYISPERIKGEKVDGRSDLYSLGIIIYELLCGEVPFKSSELIEIFKKHLYEVIEKLHSKIDIPIDFEKIILRFLRKEPNKRYSNCFEAAQDIAKLTGSDIEITNTYEESFSVYSAELIGREKELNGLLDLQKEGKSEFVIISGESGIGKSRLLKEFKIISQLNNLRYMDFKCSSKQPYGLIVEICNRLPVNENLSEKEKTVINLLNKMQSDDQLLQDLGKENFILQILDFIFDSEKDKTIIITIDDLNECDKYSLEVISYLSKNIYSRKSKNLIFILSFSNSENEIIADFENEISENLNIKKINLSGIEKENISTLFSSIFNEYDFPNEFMEKVFHESKGNIGIITSYLDELYQEKYLSKKQNKWQLSGGYEKIRFSKSTSEIILSRISKYSKSVQELLYDLSVFNKKFEARSIDTLFKSFNWKDLNLLINDEILYQNDKYYYFKSESLQEILYSKLEENTRTNLHSKVFDLYNNYSNKEDFVDVLAYHSFRCKKYKESIPFLNISGDKCKSIFANDETIAFYKNCLFAIDSADENNFTLKYEIANKLFDVYEIVGKRSEQSKILDEILILAAKLNDNIKISDVYLKQAKYYFDISEYEETKKFAEKSANLKEKFNDPKGLGEAYILIGQSLFRMNDLDRFLEYHQKGIEIFKENNYELNYANALIDLGVAYWTDFDTPEKAIQYYKEAYVICNKIANKRGQIRSIANTGLAYFTLGQYDNAINNYELALNVAKEIGDRKNLTSVQVNLGLAQIAVGKYSIAIDLLKEGLNLVQQIKHPIGEEGYLENLGTLYNFLGKYDYAIKYISEALNLAKKIENKNGICINYAYLAQIYLNKGDLNNASDNLQNANSVSDVNINLNTQITLLIAQSIYYLKLQDHNSLNKSIEYSNKAIELAKQCSDLDSQIFSLSNLSLAYLYLGGHQKALELSQQTIRIINENNYDALDVHEIYWNNYTVLMGFGEDKLAKESLVKSYEIIMRKSEEIRDLDLRETFMEVAAPNKEIISEYKNRFEGRVDLSTNIKLKNLETLYEISKTITSVLDFNELLNLVMDLALKTLKGERGMIFLLEDGKLNVKVARNVEKQSILDAEEISESIIKDVVKGGKPIITLNAKNDDRFKQRLSVINFSITSLVCVPIKLQNEIMGTVYVDSPTTPESIITFTNIDLEFLEAFANIVAISLQNARLLDKLKDENIYLRHEIEEKFKFDNMIGESPAMNSLYKIMQGAINSDGTVLIQGDSGTGKELIAKAIHYNSKRKGQKFIAIDCAALHETLLDSELFGHKKGSFTGAIADKKGLFEEANGGTIFLDEITNTNLGFQAKLLRVLQEGEIRRVGETETRFVDVRVISASNKNVENEVKNGRFREDLFFRLNVIPIFVPQLRERVEDIPVLIHYFIKKYSEKSGKNIQGISQELVEKFLEYSWPGNIRELENIINRMIIFSESDKLTIKDLPSDFIKSKNFPSLNSKENADNNKIETKTKVTSIKEVEKEHILNTLEQTKGNKTEAAKLLGLKRTTLVERMKKFGIM